MKLFALVLLTLIEANADLSLSFLKSFLRERDTVTFYSCRTNNEARKLLGGNRKLSSQVAILDKQKLKGLTRSNYHVLDCEDCTSAADVLQTLIERQRFYGPPFKYLVLLKATSFKSCLQFLQHFWIPPISDFMLAKVGDQSVDLYRIFKFRKELGLEALIRMKVLEKVSTWTEGTTLTHPTYPVWKSRLNFQKAKLHVGTVIYSNDTWNDYSDFRNPRTDMFFKLEYPVLNLITEILNATSSTKQFNTYGYYNEKTKTIDGLVNAIREGHVDFAAHTLYVISERLPLLDYLTPWNPIIIRFLVKQPSKSYIENIYFITFTKDVWLIAILTLVLAAPALWLVFRKENSDIKRNTNPITKSDVGLLLLEAVCQQGTMLNLRQLSSKIMTITLIIIFMFLYVAYSAYIVVLLQSTTKITSLSTLLESRIEVGGVNTSYMRAYFTAPKSGILYELYKKKIHPNQYFSLEQGLKKVQQGNFAFHCSLAAAYTYILQTYTNYDICALQDLQGYTNYSAYIPAPKNSPYKEIFKTYFLHLAETGIRDRMTKRLIRRPECFSRIGNFQSVRFYDCYEILMIFAGGLLLSLAVFLAELLINNFSAKRKTFHN